MQIKNLDTMSFDEFMNSKNVYLNNNIGEINETYNDIPSYYDIILTLTADLQLKI